MQPAKLVAYLSPPIAISSEVKEAEPILAAAGAAAHGSKHRAAVGSAVAISGIVHIAPSFSINGGCG